MDSSTIIQPHEEAASLIRGKPVVSRDVFQAMLPELRARAFTITGIEDADVMQHVRDTIAKLPAGSVWKDVQGEVSAELEPYLGGEGADRRATLLLRTQAFSAFQASNWRVAQEDDDTTHLQYLATEDDRVRDSHLALNGLVLPKDDSFWDLHYPPWEWNCRCRVRPMNPDLVQQERDRDEQRAPDDQHVLEGPALTQLRHGTLVRDGRAYDVTSPAETDPDAFRFHPDDLRIPLSALQGRYEPEVYHDFIAAMKAHKLLNGSTLWDWLHAKTVTAAQKDIGEHS